MRRSIRSSVRDSLRRSAQRDRDHGHNDGYDDGHNHGHDHGRDHDPSARARTGAGAPPVPLKILVSGGFGAGKTTFVGAVSEIAPLSTEELLTSASAATDRLDGIERKTRTTVAMDFGRITLGTEHVLYLFGTPGQERYWFLWEELCRGALGAVVLADTRRLEDSFPAVDYFERRRLGYVVAVNEFDGAHRYEPEEVRAALDIAPGIPVVNCDARIGSSGIRTLMTLVHHVLERAPVA